MYAERSEYLGAPKRHTDVGAILMKFSEMAATAPPRECPVKKT
jgi:hypothetical protein